MYLNMISMDTFFNGSNDEINKEMADSDDDK